jgi:hypothetical protein
MEAITLVFAVLFLAQTAVFVFLYRNAVTRRDITEKKAPKPENPPETKAEEKEAPSMNQPSKPSSLYGRGVV